MTLCVITILPLNFFLLRMSLKLLSYLLLILLPLLLLLLLLLVIHLKGN